MATAEDWKLVTDGLLLSSLGRVKAWDKIHGWRGPFKPNISGTYSQFSHSSKRYYLAREVAKAFHGPPPPDKPTVDHINGDRTDDRACNLRWASMPEQRQNQRRKCVNAQAPHAVQTTLEGEIWKASGKRGRVSNMGRAQVMRPHGNVWGPIFVPTIKRARQYALVGDVAFHRRVALAFLGAAPSATHTVDHIDGDKSNNHLSNLRWASKSVQSRNRAPRSNNLSGCLATAVLVQDPVSKEWEKFDSFSAAARMLAARSRYRKQFNSGSVGMTAKRQGTYHGLAMKLA